MRILIADDNELALKSLGSVLTGAGYEVLAARDGEEALHHALAGDARLVVTDWEMPRLAGIDLCRAVRAADLPAYVYMILLTAHDSPRERVEGLAAGADDFVAKPFDPAELLARVRSGERVLSLETRDVAIFALAKLTESRDPETGAHLERVRGYSRALAQHLAGSAPFRDAIDGDFIRLIFLTSPLHDIGKVGIPDRVLLKQGPLTPDEFEVMKTHTTLGAQTLDAAVRTFPGVTFLEMARNIAASHHERYDGGGYPAGLGGEEIPLPGRIVALADAYDALTVRRVYKPAYDHGVAVSIISGDCGTHFDPHVVRAFLESQPRFSAIRERFLADGAGGGLHAGAPMRLGASSRGA